MEKETRISSLIELIKEDRTEIREIRNRMYSTVQLFVIAAFAITAYILDSKNNTKIEFSYLLFIDLFLIALSWVYFFLAKWDLFQARKCLNKRQDLLTKGFGFNYFQDCNDVVPDIKDNELYYVIGIASIIYLALIIISKCIMSSGTACH